ncbi:MAG: hypothetical protein Q8P46_13465 [Hyphomicrobiales bacterium]|nr:hypothetical protein [Hyphomicrobiales bacterium]
MTTKPMTDIVSAIVTELRPLESVERLRVVQASLALLGETPVLPSQPGTAESSGSAGVGGEPSDLPLRTRTWLKQNQLSMEQVEQVFHLEGEDVDVIAAEIPGKFNKEKVRNAYILVGIARMLTSGEAKFDDKVARAFCEQHGFYDHTNHMKYMKGGNEFTGTKAKGWTLTSPGLKRGAELVKELSQEG